MMMMMLFALMSLALSSSASLTVAQDGGMFNEYEHGSLKSTLENILGKLISLEENMKKFIENSQEEIKGVKEILGALQDQNEKIVKGFSTLHNFGSDRVTTLEKISAPIELSSFGCVGYGTKHNVYFEGTYAQLFAPQFVCKDRSRIDGNIITCPGHDIGIIATCPESNRTVLNISRSTTVSLGHEVVAFGFGKLAKSWGGMVSDVVQNDQTISEHEHWSGVSGVRPGDFIVQGVHVGMSGSPVSNGCGYTGMAIAEHRKDHISYAIVSPVSTIHDCLRLHKEKLPTKCEGNKIIEISKYPFACESEG
jgi:hypothetical protein